MINTTYINEFNSPIRQIACKVELIYSALIGDTETTYSLTSKDHVESITIERTGVAGKFFGFGVAHKATIKLLNKNGELDALAPYDSLKIYFKLNSNSYESTYPTFFIKEIKRDTTTNGLTLICFEELNTALELYKVSDLYLSTPYTIKNFVEACSGRIGLNTEVLGLDESFDVEYPTGANFEGSESLRAALDAAAEATQTIYYIDNQNNLIFKRLDKDGAPALTIDKNGYFELEVGSERLLSAVVSTTELGDNVGANLDDEEIFGETQYIKDNPFLDIREDIATLVDAALERAGKTAINEYVCSWRGNFLLEVGDKVKIIDKDNKAFITYLLDENTTYNGGLSAKSEWSYTDSNKTSSNPTTLGEAIKETYARVDKANKKIDLVASESGANTEAIAALEMNTESISLSVTNVEKSLTEKIESANNELSTISKKVDMQLTSEDVTITVQNEIANGVSTVKTGKGFEFNDSGLTVKDINPDSNKEIETTISNNGMVVNVEGAEKLKANDEGVKAVDLHATTFLIIGANSRFEDYGSRTACFWIGG